MIWSGCLLLFAAWVPFALRAKEEPTPQLQIEALYRQYGYILRRRCRRILKEEALVDDAMQEIFITLCRSIHQYEGDPERILAWLYRITTTHCLQLLDKDRRWIRKLQEQLDLHQLLQERKGASLDEQLALNDFLKSLPDEQQEAILYRYVSGMTQDEIAQLMDVTRDQVRRWLKHFQTRGRIVLRERS